MQKVNSLSDVALDPFDHYFLDYYIELGLTGNFLKDFEEKFPKLKDDVPWLLDVSRGYYRAFLGTNNSLPVVTCRKMLLITEVCLHGCDVFDDKNKFIKWLYSTPKIFGGQRPIDSLRKENDIKHVNDVLGRIAYGVYS